MEVKKQRKNYLQINKNKITNEKSMPYLPHRLSTTFDSCHRHITYINLTYAK